MDKKLKPIIADYFKDFKEYPKYNFDLINQILMDSVKQLQHQRELQILEILKQNGFYFKNNLELEEFARTRCELISFSNNTKKILKVDGKPICEWFDTIVSSGIGYEFTLIMGRPELSK